MAGLAISGDDYHFSTKVASSLLKRIQPQVSLAFVCIWTVTGKTILGKDWMNIAGKPDGLVGMCRVLHTNKSQHRAGQ